MWSFGFEQIEWQKCTEKERKWEFQDTYKEFMESLFISDTIIFFFKYKFNLNEEYKC